MYYFRKKYLLNINYTLKKIIILLFFMLLLPNACITRVWFIFYGFQELQDGIVLF